ncbi:MAG TPA: aminoglycoside phosphotransferase family protein [Gaiellaceae bacterium]|nr:aminoglycoside phosphotransferase family protein [Gaiellaceae bacterium]
MSDGRPDLAPLELTAREIAAEWGLELGEPFVLARYSFVAPAGADAVLKVTPPEDDEADEEADALELWSGDGAVRLLDHARGRRGLLLERARPGTDLSDVAEEDATTIAVGLAGRLWKRGQSPGLSPFRSVHDHVPRWLANAAGHELAPLARQLYARLERREDALVHGDFHHHNILRSERGWLAIDPKPMLGEPEYDVPSFLWNPIPYRMRTDVTERRLAAFAAAGLDEERMRKWAVIRGAYLGADEEEVEVLRALV